MLSTAVAETQCLEAGSWSALRPVNKVLQLTRRSSGLGLLLGLLFLSIEGG